MTKKVERPTTSAERARDARAYLSAARVRLHEAGYAQTRFDQYEHPDRKTIVETGYTYGETRLVVHLSRGGEFTTENTTDLRLVGTSDLFEPDPKFKLFERLIEV